MNKRIGNIEIRELGENKTYSHEVVFWYPNKYYGHEDDYIRMGDFFKKPGESGWHIHKSCFNNPETCYVIAFILIPEDEDDDPPNLITLGSRPFILKEEDLISFEKLMREFYKTYKSCSENFGME